MKKISSVILLLLYLFSMAQTLVPVLSFQLNQEYIKTHLCRSLTQPEFKDCDGFCYLKKQIHNHDENKMDHSDANTATVPKIPFSYLVEIHSKNISFSIYSENDPHLITNESLPESLHFDIISPPPMG